VAAMAWDNKGDSYRLKLEVGLSMLITRINLLVLTSEGVIDATASCPSRPRKSARAEPNGHAFQPRRQGHHLFRHDSHRAMAGRGARTRPACRSSWPPSAARTSTSWPAISISSARKGATVFRFQLVGEEELDTQMGRLVTWHLRRP
jgi:hypothetical protein